jgi:hypothetical protein
MGFSQPPVSQSPGRKRNEEKPVEGGESRLLSANEAAKYLGISYWTLRELVWSGSLPMVGSPNKSCGWRRWLRFFLELARLQINHMPILISFLAQDGTGHRSPGVLVRAKARSDEARACGRGATMPRAQSSHPHCLKPIEKYLPRCLVLILFTCCLTSLAFPPAGGPSGGLSPGQTGTDLAQALAAASGSCSSRIFGAAPVTVGTNPRSVAVADFNEDGKADFATANYGSNDVSILLSNGDGTFQTAVSYGVGANPYSVAVGDFNGDGKIDIVTANYNSDDISILLGKGDGTFQAAVNYRAGSYPSSLAVGDFNGDGKTDLAVTNYLYPAGTVSILMGNGNGSFRAAVNYAVGYYPTSVAVGDFNGDGKLDLAVANSGSNNVSILLGSGNGTFQTPVSYGVGSDPYSVAVGDFNADGKADLAVANSSSIAILLGNGNGTFQTAVSYGVDSNPQSVAVGDFNGDGKPDLAVANNGSNNTSILLGKGDGTFQTAVNYSVWSNPYSVSVGDFNGDGKPDLAIANSSSKNVSILLGNGNGTFQAAVSYGVGSSPQSVAVADFNRDGKPDLAVANYGSNNVSILLGNGNGTFRPQTQYDVGGSPRYIAVADFNGDGKPDLVTANPDSNNVSVSIGNGDGSFSGATRYFAGSSASSVAVGDIDGDGKTDLVVHTNNGMSILLGNGDGTFQYPVAYTLDLLAIGDFNRDGKADLVVNVCGISILIGKGDGTFQTAATYTFGQGGAGKPFCSEAVVVADFNEDGEADLAVATHSFSDGSKVDVLLGKGDGSFQWTSSEDISGSPGFGWDAVAVGDFNGDGKADLAVSIGIRVLIFLGEGNGTFGSAGNYGDNSLIRSVAVGDFNADGLADLVVLHWDSNNVSILLNTSTCTAISLTSLSPSSAIAGGAAFDLTVNGSPFVSGSTVNWNGSARSTTFVSSTQLLASIPASDIALAGTAQVTVSNADGSTSSALTFTINNPIPTITSLSPASTSAGSAAFTLTVNGTNFVSTSAVKWNGTNRATTFVSSTQLIAAILVADVASAGTASVTVVNPSPGGGTSNAQTFAITATNPVPKITSLSPASATAGGAAFTLTVNGTNIVSTSTVNWNGSSRTTTFVNSTQLTASITAADIASAGTASVTVFNPAPGGGTSYAVTFTIAPAGTHLAEITSPIPGSTLTSTQVTFTWTSGTGVSQYWLYVGRTSGGNEIYNQDAASSQSASVQAIPNDGSTIYVRLWSKIASQWLYLDYTYKACSGCGPFLPGKAILISPSTANVPTTPTYVWNAVPTATWYQLWVNDSSAAPKIQTWYTAEQAGCANGPEVCSIKPTTSLAVGAARWWVQTWSSVGYGPWSDAMSFTVSSCSAPGKPILVAPSGYITNADPTYSWNAVPWATWYQLWVDDSISSGKIREWHTATEVGCPSGSGSCSITPNTSLALGWGQFWIQPWNDCGGSSYGPWSDRAVFYVGPTTISPAAMTSPAPNSKLTSSTVTFTWNAGTGPTQYWLYVGRSLGSHDLYSGDQGTGFSATVPGLPTDGSNLYVRLWSYIGGQWYWRDYTYAACNGCQ